MQIESDVLRYEEGAQRSIFSGNVHVNKGSIVMRAARLEVQQDSAGNQLASLSGGVQELAFFRQQRASGTDEYIQAQAQRIRYNSATGVVTLTGQASLIRLEGSRVMDTVTGQEIVYNGNSDVFSVNGGVATGADGASTGAGGRVRVTLSARAAASEPDVAAAADGQAPLKPSLQLKSGGGQ